MTESEDLRSRATVLDEFRSLLIEYSELHQRVDDFLGRVILVPSAGNEVRLGQLRGALNRLAPRAQRAMEASGAGIDYKPPGTMQYRQMNPIPAWSTAFSPEPMFGFGLLIDVIDQGLGSLHMRAEQAAERERTVTSKLGRVVGWPDEVRRAAGKPSRLPRPSPQYWAGLVTGFLASVAAGLVLHFTAHIG